MHTNFEKKKFHKQSVVILLKNGCSVRQMSCTISLRLFVAKALEKHVRSSSFSISLFQRKLHSHGKFTERLFLLQLLYTKFFKLIFFRTPISGWWQKNQQNLSTKIQIWRQIVGSRNYPLEITSLRKIILYGKNSPTN